MDESVVAERAVYHGIAGLLQARASYLTGWPDDLRARLHAEAVAQTMWEIRHRTVLTPLLAALGAAGVASVLLKGTALRLWPLPRARATKSWRYRPSDRRQRSGPRARRFYRPRVCL